ncbi:DUF63 family protein [Candidatus Micrarchaeota archaeon]|nr:DUF63 family protein [Candidatus Micrarchaeota archaeon]
MDNFIYDYFVRPIWDRTGYNLVNTAAYALIALAAVYALSIILRNRVKIDGEFIRGTLCFVLFGSTMRVVTDAIDNRVFQPVSPAHQFVLDSHLWDYGYLTVSPGIYILTAALMLASLAVLYRLKRVGWLQYAGLALWLPHFLLLVPFMSYAAYALPVLALGAVPAYAAWVHFKDHALALVVAGQALDGAATFFVIDIFSKVSGVAYFEQHVVGGFIGAFFGTFFAFYILKVGIAFAAAHVLRTEKMDGGDRNFVALVLMIMGFAPGIRDILRMVVAA